jgi:hypothetical protein
VSTNQSEVPKEPDVKRIMPGDLKQVMDLKMPLINVIRLFTGTGESYWTGKWRTLAAMGLVDSLLDSGNDGFDSIALEVRKHFTKEPARRCGGFFVGEDAQAGTPDSGGQVNDQVSMLKAQIRGIRVATDLIMVALESTPTESIEGDLDRIGDKLHTLVQQVKADSEVASTRLMNLEKSITWIAVKLGIEPSGDTDETLRLVIAKVDEATAVPVFSQIPGNLDLSNPPGDLTPVQTPVPDSGSVIDDASKLPGDPEQAADSSTAQG